MNKKLTIKNIKSFYQLLPLFDKYNNSLALSTSDGSVNLTYKQLSDDIKKTSALLSKHIKPGQRVVLMDLNGPNWVVAFFSVVLNKGIVVPIDQRMDKELKDEIIKMVKADIIICNNNLTKQKQKIILFQDLKKQQEIFKPKLINPEIAAQIIFTSGTWGKPKGVVLSHKNILANLNSVLKTFQPEQGSKLLSVLPLSHSYEQMCGLFVPIASGCHIIYQTKLDSYSLVQSMEKYHVNYMVVVPKFLELLQSSILRNITKAKPLFYSLLNTSGYLPLNQRRIVFNKLHKKFGGKLKTFIVGGAPLPDQLENFFKKLGFRLVVGYGLSEASPVISVSLDNKRPKYSVGFPVHKVKVKIAEDGEIIAAGENIFKGYWPLKKKKAVGPFPTGDVGFIDKSGRLFITGRKKNMVVFSTGDKVQLEDIELMALKINGVDEVCAVSIEKNNTPSIILVFTGSANEDEILEIVNKNLPLYARIKMVRRWDNKKLPLSHTLKLKRNIILQELQR